MATEGYIDGVKGLWLVGWAHDPERPGERVELDVEFDGEPVGRCVADKGRRDLTKRGVGDGRHAFRLKLPQRLEVGSAHTVVVRSCDDGILLPLSKKYVADPSGASEGQRLSLKVDPASAERDDDRITAVGEPSLDDGAGHEAMTPAATGRPSVWFALVGVERWLFTYDGPKRLAHVLGAEPRPPERAQEWVRMLRQRHDRVGALGAGYLPVTVPSKAAVYPERLPAGLVVSDQGRPADQLAAALRDEPQLELLDLLQALRHARHHGDVFLRQGRQLTWTGAFHAYRAVMKELAKRFPELGSPTSGTLKLGEPVEVTDPLRSRERVALVGDELVPVTNDDEEPEREPELARDSFDAMYVPVPDEAAALLGPRAALLERDAGSDLPATVILHDGSGGRLVPFLAEHFSRTFVDVTDKPPYELIEQVRPLTVIQILSEESTFFA